SCTVAPTAPRMCGSATLTIDASMAPISVPNEIESVTSHLFTAGRAGSSASQEGPHHPLDELWRQPQRVIVQGLHEHASDAAHEERGVERRVLFAERALLQPLLHEPLAARRELPERGGLAPQGAPAAAQLLLDQHGEQGPVL